MPTAYLSQFLFNKVALCNKRVLANFLFCFNLGFTVLQTGNSAPVLPPFKFCFGTPQQLRYQISISHSSPRAAVVGPSCLIPPPASAQYQHLWSHIDACLHSWNATNSDTLILWRARHTVY